LCPQGLDTQVLLQRFEEQLDLPALAVDDGDGGGSKAAIIGEKHHTALLFLVPDFDATQKQIVVPTAAAL
jgi:hypothetical protein